MKRIQIPAASLLITIFAFASSAHIAAQTNNWTRVKALPKNAELIVNRKADGQVVGFLQAVTDDTIAIDSDNGSFIVGKNNIEKIYMAEGRDAAEGLKRGAALGMLGGLATSITYATVVKSDIIEDRPGFLFVWIGLGIGAVVGRIHAKGKDKGALVYSAK